MQTRSPIAAWLGLGLLLALAGCQSLIPPQDPIDALDRAEALLAQGKAEEARAVMKYYEEEFYLQDDLERRKLLRSMALFQLDDGWRAYTKELRSFPDDHPFSRLRPDVAKLQFQIGAFLCQSDGSFWPFYNDKNRGRNVLEHFILHYSHNPLMADALRILGDLAFDEQDYPLAQQRFTQLVTHDKDSEWVTLASFRVAMCHFLSLEGPDYDLQEMEKAHNELRDFLAGRVEQPRFKSTAIEALRIVKQWLAKKHLIIADFYWRVENRQGAVHHTRLAANRYPETEAGLNASYRLESLSQELENGPDISPEELQ